MYNEGNRNYDIVKSSLFDFMNYDFGNQDIRSTKENIGRILEEMP